MARGESGRIVLEIDPSQKDVLYSALTKDGMTLKDWFLRQASQYLRDRSQSSAFSASVVSEGRTSYNASLTPTLEVVLKKKRQRGKRKAR